VTNTPTPSPTPDRYTTPAITDSPSSRDFEQKIDLEWTDVGLWRSDEYYVVRIVDGRDGTTAEYWLRGTTLRVHDNYYDSERKNVRHRWTVQVMRCTDYCAASQIGDPKVRKEGFDRSDESSSRTFLWQP
jgi:hypothetical protein